jgi:hypothetical protein
MASPLPQPITNKRYCQYLALTPLTFLLAIEGEPREINAVTVAVKTFPDLLKTTVVVASHIQVAGLLNRLTSSKNGLFKIVASLFT